MCPRQCFGLHSAECTYTYIYTAIAVQYMVLLSCDCHVPADCNESGVGHNYSRQPGSSQPPLDT